ncbi:MAG: glycosyltransferase family 2 protein [Nocardioides sp.]
MPDQDGPRATPLLSVVVPAYDEEAVLPLLAGRLRPVLDVLGIDYEVVLVDDGSRDLTAAVALGLRREWPELRLVRLRVNAGHQAALSAGLRRAQGAYMVTIDADLQDPPETIAEMLRIARSEELDVVYGVRSDRSTDGAFKRGTAGAFYRLLGLLTGGAAPLHAGDFRLMSRATVDAINTLPESGRVLRFVVPALGYPSASVGYRREARSAGRSKYGLWHMVRLSLDSITAVSVAPLRLATVTGLLGGLVAVLVGVVTLTAHWAGHTLPGWTSTVAIVSGFSALQLICLGIVGEYLGRTYTFLQQWPAYSVAFDSDDPATTARVEASVPARSDS